MWENGWMMVTISNNKILEWSTFSIEISRTFNCRMAELTSSSHYNRKYKLRKLIYIKQQI